MVSSLGTGTQAVNSVLAVLVGLDVTPRAIDEVVSSL